jgi:integrase
MAVPAELPWRPLMLPAHYDRHPTLRPAETEALAAFILLPTRSSSNGRLPDTLRARLLRLTAPVDDAIHLVAPSSKTGAWVRHFLLREMERRQLPLWSWTEGDWTNMVGRVDADHRQTVLAVAYLLADQRRLYLAFPGSNRLRLAKRVLGETAVNASIQRVREHLQGWGYSPTAPIPEMVIALSEAMLRTGSPRLDDLGTRGDVFDALLGDSSLKRGSQQLRCVLERLGVLTATPVEAHLMDADEWFARTAQAQSDVPAMWVHWAQRWFRTSTLGVRSRHSTYYLLLKVGRWLARHHPDVTEPQQWTRGVAVDWVTAVERMLVGEWAHPPSTFRYRERVGHPLSARAKDSHISLVRSFLRDCQEWEWVTLPFDPIRALRTPRSIRALIGPDPRVIADASWAKLLWAGLNLEPDDIPSHASRHGGPWYPATMVQAIALLWLFAGLRVGEIRRLRYGCIRWQRDLPAVDEDAAAPAKAVCLLDVPVNKTGTAFTKPVDHLVGEAIARWEAARPVQPRLLDPKTGEAVDMLFAFRGTLLGPMYVNRTLIPLLCRKANVPTSDVRGVITSHRARATIASQLYNAKDPMTLFQLQAWLGHRSPHSTQHYARITPITLAKAYTDAGYFARNVRAIEVLIDRDAVDSGATAAGTPWQYFDLGHGYCTYSFFEQCQHRMACARCDFYVPKDSTRAQLLEAKANLQHMLVRIPLTEDEQAAVEDGEAAVTRLLERLADVATPAGPTPRALGKPTSFLDIPVRPRRSTVPSVPIAGDVTT